MRELEIRIKINADDDWYENYWYILKREIKEKYNFNFDDRTKSKCEFIVGGKTDE